jgi:hypothetical protein
MTKQEKLEYLNSLMKELPKSTQRKIEVAITPIEKRERKKRKKIVHKKKKGKGRKKNVRVNSEVIQQMFEDGMRTKEIVQVLGVSERTVVYRKKIWKEKGYLKDGEVFTKEYNTRYEPDENGVLKRRYEPKTLNKYKRNSDGSNSKTSNSQSPQRDNSEIQRSKQEEESISSS